MVNKDALNRVQVLWLEAAQVIDQHMLAYSILHASMRVNIFTASVFHTLKWKLGNVAKQITLCVNNCIMEETEFWHITFFCLDRSFLLAWCNKRWKCEFWVIKFIPSWTYMVQIFRENLSQPNFFLVCADRSPRRSPKQSPRQRRSKRSSGSGEEWL